MDGLINYLVFAELLRQAEDEIANKRKREAVAIFDNALIDAQYRHVVKCPWLCSAKENMSLIRKIKIPYSGSPTNREAQVTTILRFVFEKEQVGSLKDILRSERKKREERGEPPESSDIFIAFANKDEVVRELMTKYLRTAVIRIDYDIERKAMLGFCRNTISENELLNLVNLGLDLNFRHPITKQTFLHIVAMQDLKPVVKFLIDKGTDPNLPDAWGNLPLHDAIDKSLFGNAVMLIPYTKLNARDENGVAPLHLAVIRQSPVVTGELLKYHADPNPRMKRSGYTPLHLSLMKSNNTIPKLLLQEGADPSIQPIERLSADAQEVLSNLRVLYALIGSAAEKEYPTIMCDSCLISPFSGLRTHCLVCYDYDLCPNCAILNATSKDHLTTHNMELRCIEKSQKVMEQWKLVEDVQKGVRTGTYVNITFQITRNYELEQQKKEDEDRRKREEEARKKREEERRIQDENDYIRRRDEADRKRREEEEEENRRMEEERKKREEDNKRKREEEKRREEEQKAAKEKEARERIVAEKYLKQQEYEADQRRKQREIQDKLNELAKTKKDGIPNESIFWSTIRARRSKRTPGNTDSLRPTFDVNQQAFCKSCKMVDHNGKLICPNCKSSLALHNRWVYAAKVGEGGCGTLYKAVDLQKFNSFCVIKVLREPTPEDKERHLDQFKKEAKALLMLGQLHIPLHIPKLLSFIQDDPICLVEEYIPGFALGEQPMDMPEAQFFFTSILRTLKEVHSKGLLHRDLKPDNFMYNTASDEYYLIDFGIVKMTKSSTQYNTLYAKGTSEYVAPEVTDGSTATMTSDIFSLGKTMYKLITNKTSPNQQEIQRDIIDPLLAKVLEKMTQSDPSKRYQTIDEILQDYLSTPIGGVDIIDYNTLSLSKFIGGGSYGEVYMGTWQCETVAVKQLSTSSLTRDSQQEFKKEVEIWKSLLPRYVVNLYGVCDKPPKLCMVMEYMPNGSLWNVLHDSTIELNYDLRLQLVLEVACAMRHLHQRKVYHRDLKSQNIVINRKYEAKLCDFGFSIVKKETRSQSKSPQNVAGTLQWTAPEVLALMTGAKADDVYEIYAKADVYSFGVVMWEIITRKVPHADVLADPRLLLNARLEIPADIPLEYKTLMTKCLARKPEERPTFVEIVAELEQSFNLNYDDACAPNTPKPSIRSSFSSSSSSSSSQPRTVEHVPQTTQHVSQEKSKSNSPPTTADPKSQPKSNERKPLSQSQNLPQEPLAAEQIPQSNSANSQTPRSAQRMTNPEYAQNAEDSIPAQNPQFESRPLPPRPTPKVPPTNFKSMPTIPNPKPSSYVPAKPPASYIPAKTTASFQQQIPAPTSIPKFCTNCGTPRAAGGRFCGECGAKF